MLRSAVKASAIVVLAGVFALGGYLFWIGNLHLKPGNDTYVVQSGTSLRAFARHLQQRGVLPDSYSLVWLAYLKGHSRHLKAGEYRFRKDITPLELLDQVVAGRVVEYPLVLLEGWTFKQMLEAMATAPGLTHTVTGLSPAEIMVRLGRAGVHPEGRFYPDTYYYSRGTTDVMLLKEAYAKMDRLLDTEWQARDVSVPLRTPGEALTLASIVEKESAVPEERGLIAGVFVNRLRKGMKLQTDPTVIYGMGAAYRGNIRIKDLRQNTPYNTYVHYGLPPTPIAMPSAQALHAALHPTETPALYFVSRGDGTHVFSGNLQDHNKAVIQYQLGGKAKSVSTYTKVGSRRSKKLIKD
jgi:UPF0755 protein